MAFRSMEAPKRFRIVPGPASSGFVAPMSRRSSGIASSRSSAAATAGPDDMKSVRLEKNGRSRWTA